MLPRNRKPSSSALSFPSAVAVVVLILELFAVHSADGVLWVTVDATGKKAVFDLPTDHPALRATGDEFENWKRTEFFVGQERISRAQREKDKALGEKKLRQNEAKNDLWLRAQQKPPKDKETVCARYVLLVVMNSEN